MEKWLGIFHFEVYKRETTVNTQFLSSSDEVVSASKLYRHAQVGVIMPMSNYKRTQPSRMSEVGWEYVSSVNLFQLLSPVL